MDQGPARFPLDFDPTDRYKHHLSPEVIKDPWTREEDLAIVAGQARLGNKWTEMYVSCFVVVAFQVLN